jgi:gliding motility-associated-like protein
MVTGTTAAPITYTWTSSDGSFSTTTTDPTVQVTSGNGTVKYFVTATDANGCSSATPGVDSLFGIGEQTLVVPNLITPNADNHNDCFIVKDVNGVGILPGSVFNLYNRWGEPVYRDNDLRSGDFCGSDLADGMYYYHIETGCGDKEIKGWLHIISNEASTK